MVDSGCETQFSEDYSDGELTKETSYTSLRDEVYGPQPETELDMEDIMIVEDSDCAPEYIDPAEEITKPIGRGYVRNVLGQIEIANDEITIVEPIQIINTEAA
jgi:hypothetical protein